MTFFSGSKAKNLFFILVWLLFGAVLHAQQPITLTIDTVSGNNGSQVSVSVRVADFQNIISAQGSINFLPSVASYTGITYFGLPDMNISNFGLNQSGTGKISFSWMDGNLIPRTLANNSILFTIQFTISGTSGQQSQVTLTDDPTTIEFVNGSFQNVNVNSVAGKIMVAGMIPSQGLNLLMSSLSGNPGSQLVMPVKALHFSKIIGAQGSIAFLPSVASFVGIEQIGIPGMTTSDFGVSQSGSGIITFSWTDGTLSGVTLQDTATLFAMRLNLTGASGQQSDVSFSNSPVPIEFIDTSLNARAISAINGRITINNNPTSNLKLKFDTVSAGENSEVVISCSVRNFTNILSLQGTIQFNPAVATFNDFEYFGLPSMDASNFGTTQSSSGILTYVWYDPSMAGITIPDDSVIFRIRFTLTGTSGSSSSVSFVNSPVNLEAANSIPLIIPCDYSGGQVNITGTINISTGTVTPATMCSGQSVSVPFTKSGTFIAGNVFTAQLSNASGIFSSPVDIGTLPGVSSGTINATLPAVVTDGTHYRIRVVSSSPAITGTDNGSDLSIYNIPGTADTPSGLTNLCQNPSNSIYSTTGASGATIYIWELTPPGAGSISGTGTSATVDWNNSYTGIASIRVKGTNNICEGQFSPYLQVNISPASVGGTVSGGTTICLGSPTPSLILSGQTGNVIRWQRRLNSGTWENISNLNTSYTETPSSDGTWDYRAEIQSGNCASEYSSYTTVIVLTAANVGGSVSGGTTICLGSNTGTLTLSGHNGTVLLWQKRIDNGVWTNISNTGTTFAEVPLAAGTWDYRAEVQGISCTAFSEYTTVIVLPVSVGGTVSPDASICLGSSTGTLTLTGNNGIIQKWQKRLNNGAWSDIANTNTTYSEIPVQAGTWNYRAVVSNGVCDTASSAYNTIIVSSPSAGGTVSGGNSPVCLGSSTGTMTLSGHSGTVQKWQNRLNSGAWSDIPNTGTAYSEIPSSIGTWSYKAIVKNGGCDTVSSSSLNIVVTAGTVGGSVTGGTSPLCLGNSTGTMTLSGYIGTIQKWQKRLNNSAWTDIANTNETYSETPGSAGTWNYIAIVKNGSCDTVSSGYNTIVVNSATIGGTITGGSSPVCLGTTTGTMTLTAYTGSIQKWQKRLNGGAWTDIVNTTPSYSEFPSAEGTWNYKAIVKSGACDTMSSSVVTIIVTAGSVGGNVTGGVSPICIGSSTGTMTLSGYTGTIQKWQKRFNNGIWTDIVNTNSTYSETPGSAGTWNYKAIVRNSPCDTTSSTFITIVVNSMTSGGSVTGVTDSVCLGESTGTMTLSGNIGIVLNWQKRLDGGTWTDIANTGMTYSEVPASTGSWEYRVIVQSGSCVAGYSASFVVTVSSLSVGGMVTSDNQICLGESTGTLTASGYNGNIINWMKRLNSGTWTSISHSTSTYSEVPTSVGTWYYKVTVRNGTCQPVYSDSVVIIVNDIPPAPVVTQSHDTLFSSSSSGNQWYNSSGIINGAVNDFYVPPVDDNYYVIVTLNGCSSPMSNVLNFSRVGIDLFSSPAYYTIQPNPFKDELLINFLDGKLRESNIIIYDIIGKPMIIIMETSPLIKLDTRNLSKGVYFIVIYSEKNRITGKVVKF